MGQPRHWSLIESLANVAVGYGLAFLATWIVFPIFGYEVSWSTNFWITNIFTAISIARSYLLRRAFNYLHRHH